MNNVAGQYNPCIVHHYGVSHSIITNNGSNFTADQVKTWCANLGIKLDYASEYTLKQTVRTNMLMD